MKKKILFFCFLSLLAMIPAAFAGKTELTTFYPSAYGEYINLSSSADSYFATASGNVAIGTTTATSQLHLYYASGGSNLKLNSYVALGRQYSSETLVLGDNVGANTAATDGMVNLVTHASYAGAAIQINGANGITFHTNSGAATAGTAYSSPRMSITAAGNVGIGTTAPTVQFERTCPSGFTNVKAGNNQLGCIQTAEANSGTAVIWETASDYCFDNYGGRLPTSGEWYNAMNNFALTDEADDWEWNDEAYYLNNHACSGSGGITQNHYRDDSTSTAFRCWIPR